MGMYGSFKLRTLNLQILKGFSPEEIVSPPLAEDVFPPPTVWNIALFTIDWEN